jgi:hypothetical protein
LILTPRFQPGILKRNNMEINNLTATETAPVSAPQPAAPARTLESALQYCRDKAHPYRLVGSWIWIEFSGKPEKETREELKSNGFKWHNTKGQWFFPGSPCWRGKGREYSLPEIIEKYGVSEQAETAKPIEYTVRNWITGAKTTRKI